MALGAAATVSIAKAKPFKTGLYAMHLGSMIDVIPFLFVLEPALLFRTGWLDGFYAHIKALAGVYLAASALQGYLRRGREH